ncbi:Steryl-sulfatase [Chionoecetes opilio]|uniref:Steryl-sulfatase n=1 Tax=Chionoecetes opilio TaxID=41210 RepID=A0A8J5D419_CHIOP|nr:Steryl-sulfatase [Chionoecetes opilio]
MLSSVGILVALLAISSPSPRRVLAVAWVAAMVSLLVAARKKAVEAPIQLDGLSQRLVDESRSFLQAHAPRRGAILPDARLRHAPHAHFSRRLIGQGRENTAGPEALCPLRCHRYGDNVEEMEQSDNTVVYFTSDQGGTSRLWRHRERIGGYNGRFKGGKRQEDRRAACACRGIFRWPGHIPRGVTLDTPTSLRDLMPTLLSMAALPRLQYLVPRAASTSGFPLMGYGDHIKKMPSPNKWLAGTTHCG